MADADGLYRPFAGEGIAFEPLAEAHREGVRAACAGDEAFWPLYPQSFGEGHFDASFDARLADPGYRLFAIVDGRGCAGMSGYLHLEPANAKLEIGGTYLARDRRGTGLNGRAKRALIGRAFDHGFRRIEFRVDARNARSRAAVAKLGAVHEGTLRRDRAIWTGHVRDTTVWSILAGEWRG